MKTSKLEMMVLHFHVSIDNIRYGSGVDNLKKTKVGWWINTSSAKNCYCWVYLGRSFAEVQKSSVWANPNLLWYLF